MFKALFRLFGSKKSKVAQPAPPQGGSAPAPASTGYAAASTPPPPSAKEKWAEDAAKGISLQATPEELAGITPDMSNEEIRAQLARLYQRHNRAASSFDPQLREEAEFMLETLAGLREKYSS